MKKVLILSSVLALVICISKSTNSAVTPASVTPSAGTVTGITPTRIAYLQLEKIIPRDNPDTGAHEWRDGAKKITEYGTNETAKIRAKYEKYTKLAENYEKSAKLMDAEALKKKERELLDLRDEIKRDDEDLKEVQAKQIQKLQITMAEKITRNATTYAEKFGWDMVLGGGALFVGKRVDITDEVLALLNKEYDAQKAKPIAKPADQKLIAPTPAKQ